VGRRQLRRDTAKLSCRSVLAKLATVVSKRSPVVIYDGACPFCVGWVQRLKRWDRDEILRFLPLQDPDARRLTEKSVAELETAMHVVSNGNVHVGAGAVREAIRHLRGGWVLSAVMGIPGIMWLSERLYSVVADTRLRADCEGSCGIHRKAP